MATYNPQIDNEYTYKKFIQYTAPLLTKKSPSVVDKNRFPPSGDKHDYLSLAPYWWPDHSKSDCLPWIRRDGVSNLAFFGADMDKFSKDTFIQMVIKLSTAYYYSKEQKYQSKIIDLLDTWFINPETRMNPNLNFAQSVPGKHSGRSFGIIEFTRIRNIITLIGVMEMNHQIDLEMSKKIRIWFTSYLNWLQNSEFGLYIQNKPNNHATWYDVQVVRILVFLNKTTEAKKILETVKLKRIATQITSDGKQPFEIKRTKSLFYSTFNLEALTELAIYGKLLGVDLWNYPSPENALIQKAYAFLIPYAAHQKEWEYQELNRLKSTKKRLANLIQNARYYFDSPNDSVLFAPLKIKKKTFDRLFIGF